VGSGTTNVAVSANLTGLTAGLAYRYRLVATNALGFDYGSELRFCAPLVTVNPLTWICHDTFVDPGAIVSGSPITIAAGYYHSLALKADGTVVGWGRNNYGQTNPPAGLNNVVAIAAGYDHSLALKADGSVVGWGWNGDGQTTIPAGLNNVVALAAGYYHSLALKADGTVVGWGNNSYGQTTIPAGLNNVVAIAAGYYHSLALKADGTVVGWGYSGYATPPAGLNNVVAVAVGGEHSLALKADGSVVGWGLNNYLQTTPPAGLNLLNVPVGVTGSVDVDAPGSYVLTYIATNAFGGVGMTTRTVTVIAATPLVATQPAIPVGSTGAIVHGVVNPRGAGTLAWFEYGLTTKYGGITTATNLGSYPYDLPISHSLTGLLPWMTYHYRAVASNSVGRIDGPDRTFTLSGPFGALPSLAGLADLTLPQGSNAVIWFTASPAGVDVRVRCNNSVLLPASGLVLGGSGTSRSLSLRPDPNHSGPAQITVTASDGMRAASRTFTLIVTPQFPTSLLYLTNARMVAAEAWQFRIFDFGTASTNYAVEYRPGLSPTNTWTPATNVTNLGNRLYQVNTGPPQGDTGFYRVKGLRWLTAGLDSPGFTVNEGAASGMVIIFNGLYTGTVSYTWGGTQGTNTGTVQVNGTTALIPIPPAFVSDNTGIDALRYLTLRLDGGAGFALAGNTEASVTIEENDAEWQGVLQTTGGALGFVLRIEQANSEFQGQIQSDGYGFFPTKALAELRITASSFSAVATNVSLPALAGSPLFSVAHRLDLRLDAANGQTDQSVGPTQIQGRATLVSVVPGRPYLDTAAYGTFLLLKPPVRPSTNEVPLYSAP
jgi:hypothetical protein